MSFRDHVMLTKIVTPDVSVFDNLLARTVIVDMRIMNSEETHRMPELMAAANYYLFVKTKQQH